MAKKQKKQTTSQTEGVSQTQGFTHGMISDLDPHFQLKGSYSDAKNIRLTNSEGDTFTVENIEGNSLFVDLADYPMSTSDQVGTTLDSYPTFYDRGPNNGATGYPLQDNLELSNRASIVGHVSYSNQLLLMIVARFEYDRGFDGTTPTPFASPKDRTIFLMVDFNENLKVKKVTDLRICYNQHGGYSGDGGDWQYPDLNMDLDNPVRIEHIIENESISRIYWTDNKNPLRTLNLKRTELDLLKQESLDLTPLMSPSQPVLTSTLHGSLPVGVYQYSYKYISENGGESTFSPLSNVYHVSDQAFGSSTTYGGGPKGNLGTQGFNISILDIDDNFDHIELYALFYEDLNQPPKIALVGRNQLSGNESIFQHTVWNHEIPNGLEEILIESNTWDVCKDIAIKDNILFAANLRQKRNVISEKEWNVKVMRWRIAEGTSSRLDAMLTTNDSSVKHYDGVDEIDDFEKDLNDHYCGYGQLLGYPGGMYEASNPTYDELNHDGNYGNPMWTTCLANQRHKTPSDTSSTPNWVNQYFQYRYLPDRMTLGAESFNYRTNAIGGCRVSFGVEQKVADQTQNTASSPFISASASGDNLNTETTDIFGDGISPSPTGETTFKASMSLGGSKDPHLAGNKRGYQRGDIYRFGVQIYDLNGAPGNVLWIGDIQTPEQHDVLRMINIKNKPNTSYGNPGFPNENEYKYSPFRPTIDTPGVSEISLVDVNHIISHEHIKDHKLSFIYGHAVPPVDVEWFTSRNNTTWRNLDAYIRPDGGPIGILPSGNSDYMFGGRNKAVPSYPPSSYGSDLESHDETHYLFDLYVAFEFIIPDAVCKKISGFRVVRAERKEQDRRIVQQGLLNQTAQYGDAKRGLKFGYDSSRFSQKDNEAFDDDPVFVNQWVEPLSSGTSPTPTLPEQPEYNVYLNGYLGLAENSHLAFYDNTRSDGKVTTEGASEGKVYCWPEREDSKKYVNAGHARRQGSNTSYGGPGTYGKHRRHCAYFGSYDKMNLSYSDGEASHGYSAHKQISGSIFTLDAPDSAFGIRPYAFRESDMLRIDCVLKLTDEIRFKDQSGSSWWPGRPHGFFSHCRANIIDSAAASVVNDWTAGTSAGSPSQWLPKRYDQTVDESLTFCKRKVMDDNYSALIGKYYCYDPYFGIGMEVDGGKFAANYIAGDNNSRPHRYYGWQLPIASSKEITDGEIIPSGFFKISKRMKQGQVHGFSNNTLGYVKLGRQSKASGGPTSDDKKYWCFGAVHSSIPSIKGTAAGSTAEEDIHEQDYTYDTVSTMQMGLRSIIIEVDNRVSVVRKNGPGNLDSYFEGRAGKENHSYSAWFAPLNLSALYEHSDWRGQYSDGQYTNTGENSWNELSYRSGYLASNLPSTSYSATSESIDGKTQHNSNYGKDLVPFKYLCSIVRNITPYGGYSKSSIQKTRYMACGNFHSVTPGNGDKQGHVSQVFGGDTFVNLYSHQKTSSPYMKKSAARWQVFPVESYVNTDMRSGLTLNAGDTVFGEDMKKPPFSNDWLYNSVYSQENNIKSALVIDEDTFDDSLNLPYEIAYSNTKILGQKTDTFRQFPINQFHDMEGLYGEINRIINFKNEIYILQDTAFAKLLVNPLSMLSDDAGTSLFTGTGETVENHIYISTKYGSRHRFSVALSEKSLYFVDSNFGRLFKYDTEKLISLGDALGQRNYLKYIIKEWEQRAYRICPSSSGGGGSAGGGHSGGPVLHGTNLGRLDSVDKPTGSRNYFSDNPLNFLGITSIFDFKNKELLITFHNSSWNSIDHKRQTFARTVDNHSMGSATDGEPVGISETLVYNEGVNAFIAKYSVAPPQWLAGGQGSFIVCPENEINVNSIANLGAHDHLPYYIWGSNDSYFYRNRRCNPLRLWVWDKHNEQKKTNFFGKKDDFIKGQTETSPQNNTAYGNAHLTFYAGLGDVADESYIVKIINSEASNSKVFDNAQIVMTPDHVDYSTIDYTTDITHDTINIKNVLDLKETKLDETEQLVINRRWDFDGTTHGWYFTFDGSVYQTFIGMIGNVQDSTITLEYTGDGKLRSPNKGNEINVVGKHNNIIRMRVKRTLDGSNWEGKIFWTGYDPIRKERGDYVNLVESSSRSLTISEPDGIDNDFVIIEWDMSPTVDWNDCIIKQIRIDLSGTGGASTFEVDWIEIGGLQADKYLDGTLRLPLRTESSPRRTRGTWAKIKYSAKTTDKFNIFAILAKYRKTY